MAKKELFRKKIFAWLIAALGAFPIDREGADITAIKTALGSVRAGQKLIIWNASATSGTTRAWNQRWYLNFMPFPPFFHE